MFEKVNPGHPDKMADRLAGAVVDLVYERAGGLTKADPRVACEVMAGHGRVDVQIETSLGRMDLRAEDIDPLIAGCSVSAWWATCSSRHKMPTSRRTRRAACAVATTASSGAVRQRRSNGC